MKPDALILRGAAFFFGCFLVLSAIFGGANVELPRIQTGVGFLLIIVSVAPGLWKQ